MERNYNLIRNRRNESFAKLINEMFVTKRRQYCCFGSLYINELPTINYNGEMKVIVGVSYSYEQGILNLRFANENHLRKIGIKEITNSEMHKIYVSIYKDFERK